MIRLLLLLVILGSLALFAVQNLAPVSLVILGVPTLAFPLAFWVLGAIGAGALTTIVMAGLIEFTRLRSRPAAQPTSRPIGDRFNNFRTGGWSAASSDTGRSAEGGYAKRSNPRKPNSQPNNRSDDWDANGDAAWDDWEETPTPRPAAPQTPQAPIRDREDTAWSDWQGYEDSPRRRPPPDAEPIPYRDSRTDFEVDQQPTNRSQSGSVYSYSYRPPEEPSADLPADKPPVSRSNSIYDAEFRVIMPPTRPVPEESSPPPSRANNSDDEEWDFMEDDSEQDRQR